MTSNTVTLPLQISDYYTLPISLPPLKSFPTPATHYLYLHPNEPKIPDPTTPRSLFLVNVPIDATDVHIRHLFSTQLDLPSGRIEEVRFEGTKKIPRTSDNENKNGNSQVGKSRKRKRGADLQNLELLEGSDMPATWDREIHRSGSTAVVLFVDRLSMEMVVKAVKKNRKLQKVIMWGDQMEGRLPQLGSTRYLNHHRLRYPDKAQLLESVNNYMTAYAAQETARTRLLARQRQEPDEDGFIKVTRGGRTGPARQEEAQEKAEKQKEKQKGLDDFYRFQTREKRKERAGELIKKFEDDKEKVRKMRETRGRFRPER